MLADNDFGHTAFIAVLVVHLVPVQEDDQIRILLNRPGFTQIRHYRALVGPLFQRAVQLRQGQYRTIQLLGDPLQGAGNFRNFVHPVFHPGHLHQLQVIDHDQAQFTATFAGHPAGTGAHFQRA